MISHLQISNKINSEIFNSMLFVMVYYMIVDSVPFLYRKSIINPNNYFWLSTFDVQWESPTKISQRWTLDKGRTPQIPYGYCLIIFRPLNLWKKLEVNFKNVPHSLEVPDSPPCTEILLKAQKNKSWQGASASHTIKLSIYWGRKHRQSFLLFFRNVLHILT